MPLTVDPNWVSGLQELKEQSPESLDLHKVLSGHTAANEWQKHLLKHFDVAPSEVFGATVPKSPTTLATVKVRISNDHADLFEAKNGVAGVVVRRL